MNALTLLASAGGDGDHGWWIVWPLLWIAVIVGLVWFFASRGRGGERSGADRARDILAERFARGELSADEYRQRLSELKAV
jgi:putative membrane protein